MSWVSEGWNHLENNNFNWNDIPGSRPAQKVSQTVKGPIKHDPNYTKMGMGANDHRKNLDQPIAAKSGFSSNNQHNFLEQKNADLEYELEQCNAEKEKNSGALPQHESDFFWNSRSLRAELLNASFCEHIDIYIYIFLTFFFNRLLPLPNC